MTLRCIFIFMSLYASACQSTLATDRPDEVLATILIDTFETSGSHQDTYILDRRIRLKSDPLGDGVWFYYQLNTGPERKLYRQRVMNLKAQEDGTVLQRSYGLKMPQDFENLWDRPNRLSGISAEDITPYFDQGCGMVWTPDGEAWSGYVDPQTCVIKSRRRNKSIRIESEARIEATRYLTNERGFEMDMTFLWGTKPGDYITLTRK